VEILQLHVPRFSLHSFRCRNDYPLQAPNLLVITSQHGTHRNTVFLVLHVFMLWSLPSNSHCLQNHLLVTGLYATVCSTKIVYNSDLNSQNHSIVLIF
jgi:hypothetical protein